MRMRNLVVGFFAVAVLAGPPRVARAHGGATEAGLAIESAALNVAYVPCKAIVAAGGLVVGAVVGLLAGGDSRAAYALWVPAAGGTFLVTPAHLDGSRPLEFFGADYADEPSPMTRTLESSAIYEAYYE